MTHSERAAFYAGVIVSGIFWAVCKLGLMFLHEPGVLAVMPK